MFVLFYTREKGVINGCAVYTGEKGVINGCTVLHRGEGGYKWLYLLFRTSALMMTKACSKIFTIEALIGKKNFFL